MSEHRTTVYYDGGCPVCLRGKKHFTRLDWARRLDWVDLLEEPDALADRGVDFAQAMEHMHVVDREGRLRAGGWAFAALWAELPGYRHLAAALRAAGMLGVMDRIYRRAVRGRYSRRCRDGLCATAQAQGIESLASTFGDIAVPPAERTRRMRCMFERIAPRYDLMNDLMSFGIHRLWKRSLVWGADPWPGEQIVDLAGGTGDLAKLFAARGCRVLVCDPAIGMMASGRPGAPPSISWAASAGEALPLRNGSVDAVVVAFGLRNMTSPLTALAEARRVLRPGGRFLCLEFSHPIALVAPFYGLFSRAVIPVLGTLIAGDRAAYRYLIESIRRFPSQQALATHLRDAGFESVRYNNVSFGIGCIHIGEAPDTGPASRTHGHRSPAVTKPKLEPARPSTEQDRARAENVPSPRAPH